MKLLLALLSLCLLTSCATTGVAGSVSASAGGQLDPKDVTSRWQTGGQINFAPQRTNTSGK